LLRRKARANAELANERNPGLRVASQPLPWAILAHAFGAFEMNCDIIK